MEKCSVVVELRAALQQPGPDVEPFLAVVVTGVGVDGDAVQVEFRLVPAADDVQAGAPVGDMVDGGEGLGGESGCNQRHVHGAENGDPFGDRT